MSRDPVTLDPWQALRAHTPARVALGRSGVSVPTQELLRFGAAHAMARDAVHLPLDVATLGAQLEADGWPTLCVHSAAPDRATYLLRPDLGRRLSDASAEVLAQHTPPGGCDLLLVVGDGLSSLAVTRHAAPLLAALRRLAPTEWRIGTVVMAEQARVALGDPIGEQLGARLVAVLIGERPGLSSPDSLGVYLTHAPRRGRTDAERNCLSNIRPEGLGYEAAAHKLVWLCSQALQRGLTGIGLKDESGALPPPGQGPTLGR
ncbi:ethanolamine ammonia-lyase subunit EutC [Piscinibacter gummiphilus]|uniref:Ethanolamine ammonia-lyase small subunit n=1 Tax=Piscinibacter gummiphilus TaxID=946333 RepID=A0ABZ0D114_9BURK|nr:ethanolamine ammonia-lyase subunit EutC [Piscinibacter gummiphilus]WOB08414.1 ethanolamine ammonia-lyase subunit EutC [Piscinibacter gummiphilus]